MPKRVTKGNLWGFIQSRPYASVADIRRLFLMDVDGAAIVGTTEGNCYIGLPQDAADLIRQLWYEGRIVLDLNPDVKARVVQGVYPARVAGPRSGGQPAPPPVIAGKAMDLDEPAGAGAVATSGPGPDGSGSPSRKRRRKRRKGPRPDNEVDSDSGGIPQPAVAAT